MHCDQMRKYDIESIIYTFMMLIIIELVLWIQKCQNFSSASSALCIMQYTVCPCLVSCPFYSIPIIIPFLLCEMFHFLVYVKMSLKRSVVCNNQSL